MKEGEKFWDVRLKERVTSLEDVDLITGSEIDLEIKVIDNNSDFDALEDEWDMLTERTDHTIYQTYLWNRIWWKYYGNVGSLFLITFYDREQLVGIFPDYLSLLSKSSRSHSRRALKRVKEGKHKIFDVRETNEENEVLEKFDRFVQMHQDRWNRKGFWGVFAEERIHRFYQEIVQRFNRKGWLQLKFAVPINEEECPVAMDLNFKYKDRVYGEHCAIDDKSSYFKMGPGTSLLNHTLFELTESRELSVYDLGRGDYSYKKDKSTEVNRNKVVTIGQMNWPRKIIVMVVKDVVKRKRWVARKLEDLKLFFVNSILSRGVEGYRSFQGSTKIQKW